MKKHYSILVLLMFLFVGFTSVNTKASLTVATFADPSKNSSNPLFTVDFTSMKLTGGWSDNKTGLILEIPYSGYTIEDSTAFQDAWFEMSIVDITSVYGTFGQTSDGEINFYENGNTTNPLVTINFESGFVSRYGLGADEIFLADNVTITGSKITGTLSEEQFAFSFANLAKLPGNGSWNNGFTTTAAFTSSALVEPAVGTPEPATLCLLGLGSLILLRRKHVVKQLN
ncbi:MAG: PEP-CTERM sorting domain-containing protein [Phycisphaerae bacterium]|jgi:hypothetical protein